LAILARLVEQGDELSCRALTRALQETENSTPRVGA
jgi:hypothetical protein